MGRLQWNVKILQATIPKDILEGAGTISHEKALEKAHKEYDKYMRNHLTQAEKDYLEIMGEDIKKLK